MSYYVTNENSFLDIKNAHLRVTGNVHTDVLKVGSIGFQPAGSNISGTVNFTNVTTGVTTTSNLNVGGTLNLGTIELSASTHTLDHITARGNVTSTTVQFDNAHTSLVTSGNVEIGGELTVSGNVEVGGGVVSNVNLLSVSNVASIKKDSNVVTEFPRSKKLIKYPRVALTNSASGGYEVDASTEFSTNYIWKAFDQDSNTFWHADYGSHLWNSSGDYIGGVELITGHDGDWITLKLPTNERISPRGIRVFPRGLRTTFSAGQAPKDVVVIGSNDGSSWDVIATTTLTNYSFGTNPSTSTPDGEEYIPATFDFEATEYYQYVGIIIESIYTGNHANPSISQLEFLGVPEYDPEAHGTDVVVKSVPNVPNTDWLEVYYDAKGLSSGPVGSSISGLGGTTISATKLGDPQVSNDAFVFDGSGDAIVSGATSLSGKPSLSYSVWFKTNSISSGTGSNSIVMIGHAGATTSLGFRIKGTGDTNPGTYRFYVYGGATNESVDTGIKAEIGTWTHATVVYNGLNSKLYMDGKFVVENTNTATNLALDSGAKVALGNYIDSNGALYDATRSYDGSIANFRLFNRALTSDEVWQLYAYQKEYFGHGDLGMTLKAGRLGIGTSEPKVALDVRGDIYRNGIPAFPIPTAHFYKQSSSTTSTTHTANIRSGWVALTHAHVTVPGVIEAYQLSGANYTTDSSSSGLVVKLCKEGLYKIQFTCALSTQSTINSHIGIDIRPVSTGYISENTGTEHIGLGDANGYTVINAAAGSDAQHMCHRFEILKVTKAPGYAYVSMTPNSNDASHFRFENYGNVPYAVMNVMYLG